MKNGTKKITTEKENGRFYTPDFIVKNILDLSNYCGERILKKHAIDNSCGDGAFLRQIVKRYCEEAQKNNYTTDEIASDLSSFIHGIEIERVEYEKCLKNISKVAEEYGVRNVEWDVICGDTLTIDKYNGQMDFVLGNPPYIRVHNLGNSFDEIKNFSFAQNGMTDMFIVFYEIGIKMLSENGILGYITPSSYFTSLAGAYMRHFFTQENLIQTIVDLKHFQAFSATTYTAITILQKNRTENAIRYYQYDEKTLTPYYIDSLLPNDCYIAGNFYFSDKQSLNILQKIFFNTEKCDISVKNGYATLCDDVFVHAFDFDSQYLIPVIKASKGITKRILYPYDCEANLVSEEELKKDSKIYTYLLANKDKLRNRSNEKDSAQYWYAFGRSQALLDTYKDKLAINTLLRTEKDFKFIEAPAGTGVYSGLYIISETLPLTEIKNVLQSNEFISYISLLGKYKSGGYYTFSSKDIKKYLDYKFAYNGGKLSC